MMEKLRVLDLFAGIGGFSLGLERTGGFETVAFCEIEPFPRKVLKKHWPKVHCYEDVTKLTGAILAADGIRPNVITGGFPCQDISIAGLELGIGEGTRSGLFTEIVRIAGDLRPDYIILENVTNLLSGPSEQPGGWFGDVLGALAEIGYDAEWEVIPAEAVGAPHPRGRVWVIAYPECEGREGLVADDILSGCKRTPYTIPCDNGPVEWCQLAGRFATVRNGDGLSVKMERDRLRGLGNAVVPQIPELIGYAILEAEKQRIAA